MVAVHVSPQWDHRHVWMQTPYAMLMSHAMQQLHRNGHNQHTQVCACTLKDARGQSITLWLTCSLQGWPGAVDCGEEERPNQCTCSSTNSNLGSET